MYRLSDVPTSGIGSLVTARELSSRFCYLFISKKIGGKYSFVHKGQMEGYSSNENICEDFAVLLLTSDVEMECAVVCFL